MKALFYLIAVCFLLSSCKDQVENQVMECPTLENVSNIPNYSSRELTSQKWKLIGFVSDKGKTIKLAEPEGDDVYTLTFHKDGTLTGISSTNQMQGSYKKSGFNLKINDLVATKINELPDGQKYIEVINRVNSFQICERGLTLFYDTDMSLLFKPINTNDLNP